MGAIKDYKLFKGYSVETSGGLLMAVSEENVEECLKLGGWVVGKVVEGNREVRFDDL